MIKIIKNIPGQSVERTYNSILQQQQQQENLLAQQAKIDEMMRKQYEQATKVDLILVPPYILIPPYIFLPIDLAAGL